MVLPGRSPPEIHGAHAVPASDAAAVGAYRHAVGKTAGARKRQQFLARAGVPHSHVHDGAGDKPAAVGVQRHAGDAAAVAREREQLLPRTRVPDLYGPIALTADEAAAA